MIKNKNSINDFVAKSKKNKQGNKLFLDFGSVNSTEAKQISKITGLNLLNYKRSLDESGVRHALKHNNITDSDFNLIPIIVLDYDFIGEGKQKGTIVYKKIIGKEYFYVEVVRKSRKKLVIKTLYKRKKRKTS